MHATMQDVAEELGVSVDIVTLHIVVEEQPVVEAFRWYYFKFGRQLRATMALHSNLRSAMEAFLIEFVEMCLDQFAKSQANFKHSIFDLGPTTEEIQSAINEMQVDWQRQVHDKFQELRHDLVNPDKAESLAVFYITLVEGIYEMINYGTPEGQLYEVVELSLVILEKHMNPNSG
ncbi:hypothetical protein PsAD13_02837 [Pseudovibrio sp. Ad13]|nr:hypothetical protein PsAD13_02837 [Pseudovibrio sp. Ad13]